MNLNLPGMEPPPALPQPTADEDDFFTPKWLLDWLPPIGLDPCWHPRSNVRSERTFDLRQGESGLAISWYCNCHRKLPESGRIVWVNCPYNDCARWVARCHEQSLVCGHAVVALIPAKPGEHYWHEHIWGEARWVGFLRGRMRFDTVNGPAPDCATFGSALVIWGNDADESQATIINRSRNDPRKPWWVR